MDLSFDLYAERALQDRGIDRRASRAFAREINPFEMRSILERTQTIAPGDKVSLASVSLMVGAPLFFMGLGAAAFQLFDCMDRSNLQQILEKRTGRKFQPALFGRGVFGGLSMDNCAAAAPCATLVAMDAHGYWSPGSRAAKGKAKELDEAWRRRERMLLSQRGHGFKQGYFLAAGRSWVRASKLWKHKRLMEDQLEKLSQTGDGNALKIISRLRSSIDRLDKELKRLGC